ncbi:U1 small nuclear ribonucleoprotein [Trypanosoma grayi]|uniref:U1 small nuclear ribonucleoprotein n=1 Tax=Trypanosoma grayi TaxID=71804 RepID=UPI0004F4733D|nr:U1 small nuclear ribonucleoprotein [Trypanosoma grayi]KEG13526.1 U1 small nuclear ribonucleoprotein [Trypanosoma grayi]
MQAPSEKDIALHEALRRRVEEHARWKASFFQSRPPPAFVPTSHHRRRREPIAGAPVHHFFKRAMELAAAEGPPVPPPRPNSATEDAGAEEPSDKGIAWDQQMRREMARRNPYTDVKICSDPQRTVVVSSLPPKAVEEDIRAFSEQFGRVVSVRLICDNSGKSRRYGFVQFGLEAEARKAVASSRKRRLCGRAVVMDMERGRLEPGFLPKRIAEAQRLSKAASAGNSKRQRVEEKRGECCVPTTRTGASLSERPAAGHRDEVDAFLDDIMNL